MKVVLDTNCLLPAIFDQSPYYWLWELFCAGQFTLCCSTEILQEYEELLSNFYSPDISESVVQTLMNAENVALTTPYFKWNLIVGDADDNKFVDCALCAGADYIVSNDKHFNVLKELNFPKISVVDIEAFKKIASTKL